MKKIIIRTISWTVNKLFSKNQKERFVVVFSNLLGINLLKLAYNNVGILKSQDYKVSGEAFVIESVLPRAISKTKQIIFDVGANEGEYSNLLTMHFPDAEIYSFEPVVDTYNILNNNIRQNKNIKCFNVGLGDRQEVVDIYTYDTKDNNKHASVYSSVITDLHHAPNDVKSFTAVMDTIDDFCKKEEMSHIDFLKIDTEGHELSVLKGATSLLERGAVKLIQFEFNEMNIVSRVFLKDFYDLLNQYSYDLYRMDEKRLVDIREYKSRNEIFAFQNILAVRKDIML